MQADELVLPQAEAVALVAEAGLEQELLQARRVREIAALGEHKREEVVEQMLEDELALAAVAELALAWLIGALPSREIDPAWAPIVGGSSSIGHEAFSCQCAHRLDRMQILQWEHLYSPRLRETNSQSLDFSLSAQPGQSLPSPWDLYMVYRMRRGSLSTS